MRPLHLLVGLLAILAFVIIGQIMSHDAPRMMALSTEARLMLRLRHTYVLAGALVNLMLGIYVQPRHGWSGIAQDVGTALLIISPTLLIAEFLIKPPGFHHEMLWTSIGLYTLLGGAVLHLASSMGRKL